MIADGQVAQLVEQWTENPRVGGSTPPLTTFKSLRASGLRQSGWLKRSQTRLLVIVLDRSPSIFWDVFRGRCLTVEATQG